MRLRRSPVVIQEAFASGRPVICSGIGGTAEKVKDGVSALCAGLPPARDRNAMARDYLALFAEIAAAQPVA